MRHADSFRSFRLPGINGYNSAADGFRHISSRVDGHNHDGCCPYGSEFDGVTGKVRQAVIEEHRLQHHRRAAENLHINTDNHPDQRKEKALDWMIVLPRRDRIQHPADKTDQTADCRADQCEYQGVFHPFDIGLSVSCPKLDNIRTELCKFVHNDFVSVIYKRGGRIVLPPFFSKSVTCRLPVDFSARNWVPKS